MAFSARRSDDADAIRKGALCRLAPTTIGKLCAARSPAASHPTPARHGDTDKETNADAERELQG